MDGQRHQNVKSVGCHISADIFLVGNIVTEQEVNVLVQVLRDLCCDLVL